MAREVVIDIDGIDARWTLSKVSREKLYGRRRRVVVDEHGQECTLGQLAVDGATLLTSGSTAAVYLDGAGMQVPRGALVASCPATGEPLPVVPSTLSLVQPAVRGVSPERVLDHKIVAVYELTGDTVLGDGEILETQFAYSKGVGGTRPMFILANEHGTFGLVGEQLVFEFVYPGMATLPGSDDLDVDDDLDFGMW